MKRLTVPVTLAVLLALTACDQSGPTSKTDTTEKPGKASETKPGETNTPAKKPGTQAEAPAKKKANPCKEDRKKLCAGIKDNAEAIACLKEHKGELSVGCRGLLKL